MRACYDYLWKVCRYERTYDKAARSKVPEYASYMLSNGKGNCYRCDERYTLTVKNGKVIWK